MDHLSGRVQSLDGAGRGGWGWCQKCSENLEPMGAIQRVALSIRSFCPHHPYDGAVLLVRKGPTFRVAISAGNCLPFFTKPPTVHLDSLLLDRRIFLASDMQVDWKKERDTQSSPVQVVHHREKRDTRADPSAKTSNVLVRLWESCAD